MSAVPTLPATSGQRALHVLAAARSLPFHGIGGMQAIAWDVLRGLARRGHRVTVLTTAIPGRPAKTFAADDVTVVPLAGTVPGQYSGGWWRASRRYAERHLATPADAVLSVSSAAAGLLPLKRSKLAVPFVFQAHGSSWAEARTKWQSSRPLDWVKSARNVYWLAKDARIYRGFDRLVFVGDTLAEQFAAPPLAWMTRGIPRATIVNGVDTALFRYDARLRDAVRARYGFTSNDRVLVFAARLHAHKGAAQAVRALAILRARNRAYRLLIVGDGGEAQALRRLAAELACTAAVKFAGPMPRTAMPELLSAGDAFVFPVLGREGLPLNVLEALSVGLPCVCAESLRATFGALAGVSYAPPRDAPAFAAAIDATVRPTSPGVSLLPADYSLERCISAYEAAIGCGAGS
ncbi:MAG: glycosyltransferase family 4 protein [Gammaproteobacteria bacterium]